MQYLLSVTIGPVQGFIAASRKTRDLWYGSELLSRASKEAAKVLSANGQLIFPHESALSSDTSIPNKLLAVVGDDPPSTARAARNAAIALLRDDWQRVRDSFSPALAQAVDTDLGNRQVEDFFEFYAAWWPYDPNDYPVRREKVERLLSGRKALRDFEPAHGVPDRAKSSLEPGLESVIQKDSLWIRAALRLKAGEELDAVSLTKRLAASARFVSTSRLAIEPFVERVTRDKAEALGDLCERAEWIETQVKAAPDAHREHDLRFDSPVEAFDGRAPGMSHFDVFPYDTQLFWDDGERDIERHKKKLDKAKELTDLRKQGMSELQASMAGFHTAAKDLAAELGTGALPTYLAVLAADGDRMGVALSKVKCLGDHQQFSARLLDFAKDAATVVAEHQGALIYSGGDDVLAFLPVHKAIACAQELREKFGRVNSADMPCKVTLSVGIAIGHYGAHMQNLLQWARDAEKLAKEYREGQRNALAVSLYPHSGGNNPTSAVSSWDDKPGERWETLVEWHRENLLPDSAAFDLRTLADQLAKLDDKNSLTGRRYSKKLLGSDRTDWSLLELEVDRVLRRKRGRHGKDELANQMVTQMLDWVGDDLGQLNHLVSELLISRRIAEVLDIAEGRLERKEAP